jgi:hypothetical protein
MSQAGQMTSLSLLTGEKLRIDFVKTLDDPVICATLAPPSRPGIHYAGNSDSILLASYKSQC